MIDETFCRYRVKISIDGPMAWLSHLDLLSAMERGLRRAALPLRFSEGFNPHILIAFGPAHPVGLRSEGEYFDLDFREAPPADWCARVNGVLPHGLRIEAAEKIPLQSKALMAIIDIAEYQILLPGIDLGTCERACAAFLALETCPIERHSPKGIKTVDIRPAVLALEANEKGLRLLCRIGVPGSPRPAEVLTAALPGVASAGVIRTGLYISDSNGAGHYNKIF